MSQSAFLATFDQAAHAAFATAGMADAGQYTAPGETAAIAVKVYVDRAVESEGQGGQLLVNQTEVSIVCEAGFTPRQKARLVVDGATFELSKLLSFDGSISRWSVRHA